MRLFKNIVFSPLANFRDTHSLLLNFLICCIKYTRNEKILISAKEGGTMAVAKSEMLTICQGTINEV